MSFNAFKEALRPCKTNSSSSSCSSSSSSSQIQIPLEFDSSIVSRKPPKSSLTRQLLRLQEDTASRPQIQLQSFQREFNLNSSSENDGNSKAEEEKGKESGLEDPKLESFRHLDHTGPYEPLVLSLPGEIPVVEVPASINSRLLEHQREGVKFLYNLYRKNHGGILGDDISYLFLIKLFNKVCQPRILVFALPSAQTLVGGCENIFCFSGDIDSTEAATLFVGPSFFSTGKLDRDDKLRWEVFAIVEEQGMGIGKDHSDNCFLGCCVGKGSEPDLTPQKGKQKKGPVLIICPSSVILNWESEFSKWSTFSVSVYHGPNRDLIMDKLEANDVEILITSFDTYRIQGSILSDIQWEIVVIDEAHRLKNEKSKLYIECLNIRTLKRYGLTGTIMQNKIWNYSIYLTWWYLKDKRRNDRASYDGEGRQCCILCHDCGSLLNKLNVAKGQFRMVLSGLIFIGRIQRVVIHALFALSSHAWSSSSRSGLSVPLHSDSTPPLVLALKIYWISNHLELIKPNPKDDREKQRKDAEFAAAVFDIDSELVGGTSQNDSFMGVSDVRHCGKMRALERLMHSWISIGDKILLFSYSVRMLDILEKFIIRKGYSFSRLDGSTPAGQRQSLVDDFNSSPSKQVFLISTRAGGLGLNLVSANRVVIFDPNWNPAQDLQAQDRSFRFGQKRHVTVFRLLAAGSLEELVYMRQVYKQQLSNIAVAGKVEKRYFEGVQDCKKFQGELFGICNLFRDLSDKHFSSEILEFHENEGKEYNHIHTAELDLTEPGIDFDPQKKTAAGKSVVYASNDPKDKRKTRLNPVLEDLGGGNTEHGLEGRCESAMPPAEERKESDADEVGVKENSEVSDSSKRRKSDHCSLLALLMGMEEVELNKLLLSDPRENGDHIPNG
ncbi:UNVERIFIED_CONTAM: Switch 2 [Sesamum calycinum]|uniref:Switch 2 n=1 Tax=Sesamum calycinum TaxID=2727403 RepID=A0AAW2MCQ1_9LAMI